MPQGKATLPTDLFIEFAAKVVTRLPRQLDLGLVKDLVEHPGKLGPILQRAFDEHQELQQEIEALDLNFRADDIMSHLQHLSKDACVRTRPGFHHGSSKWYVDIPRIVVTSLNHPSFSNFVNDSNGATPQEAIINTWNFILKISLDPNRFLMFYYCPPNVPIPGNDPQVWVRWSEVKCDWEDVSPTPKSLADRGITAYRILPLAEHLWRQGY